jgi:hypothetical protein
MFAILTYANASHTCAAGSFDSGGGVFYNNAPVGRYTQPRGRNY